MNTVHVYEPKAEDLAYTFGGLAPFATVRPGEILRIRTEDCFGGRVTGPDQLPTQVTAFPYLNPVTGPFYVEGAEPGDTLALHLVSVRPVRNWAVSSTFPHFGALTSTAHTATLQPPLEERVWMYDLDLTAGVVRYRATRSNFTVDLPMDPMLGTVGVAPAGGETRLSIVPDAHGGNLDTPEMRAGVTAYFGVNVEGALFALGDGHARQGHGEVGGVAVEAAMETTLIVDLIKGTPTPWPRLESDQHLMSIGLARPLEDAFRISQHDLVTWAAGLSGLELLDAYQLISQTGEAPVGNVCDANYSMVAKVAKAYLGPVEAYGGVHAALRAVAEKVR